jgi:hypothetical protein
MDEDGKRVVRLQVVGLYYLLPIHVTSGREQTPDQEAHGTDEVFPCQLKDQTMKQRLLAIIPLACSMTSAFAGADPFLEYNCMGMSGPSAEAAVASAAAAKPASPAVLKKDKSLAASSTAGGASNGAAQVVATADRTGLKVKVSCSSASGKC